LIAVAGLLKIYPYGTVRYASYLLFPVILLLGICLHYIFDSLLIFTRSWEKYVVILVGLFFVVYSGHSKFKAYVTYKEKTLELYRLVKNIDAKSTDLILMGAYYSPVFKQFRPDFYNSQKLIQIGWGSSLGKPLFGEKDLINTELLKRDSVNRIIVINSSLKEFQMFYPSYSELLFSRYYLEKEVSALNTQTIWCGYFRLKDLQKDAQ
jgi:hypothetical protein